MSEQIYEILYHATGRVLRRNFHRIALNPDLSPEPDWICLLMRRHGRLRQRLHLRCRIDIEDPFQIYGFAIPRLALKACHADSEKRALDSTQGRLTYADAWLPLTALSDSLFRIDIEDPSNPDSETISC